MSSFDIEGNKNNFKKQFLVDSPDILKLGDDPNKIILKTRPGVYNFLKNIPNEKLFTYFFIGMILFNILFQMNITPQKFIILFMTIILLLIYYDRERNVNLSNMETLELKLSKIVPKTQFFYIDVGLIEIFYSIRDLRQYNMPVYDKIIKSIDEFLKLYFETYVSKISHYHYHYDVLFDLKKNILNMMHSMTYNLKYSEVNEKLKIAMKGVHLILNYYINQIKIKNNMDIKENGINSFKREIEIDDQIKGYYEYDKNYDIY